MERQSYPTDVTDEQWELLREVVPAPKPGPGHAPIDRREIVNALLYVTRTGIQWRMMPHDLPKWATVYEYFEQWRDNGVFDKILETLRPKVRRAAGRGPRAHLAIVDSQSARTTESGGERGFDGNKKILGRKRHIVVDADGIPIVVEIGPANVHDSQPAPRLFSEAKALEPELAEIVADSAYEGLRLAEAANDNGMRLTVIRRRDPKSQFVPLPRRWVVERTFAWLGRSRRLAKDYERHSSSSRAMVQLAAIQLMLRRVAL